MNKELQKKLAEKKVKNPIDEVVDKLLENQAKSCVRAKVLFDKKEQERND